MSTYKSNAMRLFTSAIIFMLIATMLPMRPASAQNGKIVLTKDQADEAVWRAAARKGKREKQQRQSEDLKWLAGAFEINVMDGFERYSVQGSPRSKAFIQLFKDYLDTVYDDHGDIRSSKFKSIDDVTRTFFNLASQHTELKEPVIQLWLRYNNAESYRKYSGAPDSAVIAASVYKYGLARLVVHQHDAAMGRVFKKGKVSEGLSRMIRETIGKDAPPILNFDARAYMSVNKDDPVSKVLLDKLQPDGSLVLSEDEIKAMTQAEFGKINASIEDVRKTIVSIDAKQDVLVDYMTQRELREQEQARATAKAQEHQLKLQASASALDLLSTLVGFSDPKLANEMKTVGNSALQIGESVNGWMKAVAGLSTLDKVTSLSTVVATGNIVGAVMNVVSLFGESAASPDQMILVEIGKLRQQVSEMRNEMHDRFDRVDQQLNTIYTTMQDRFDLIDVQLGKINGSLQDIQLTLASLDSTLTRIERNNFEFMDAANRRPLLNSINSVLGYQQRTGLPLPYAPQFVDAESLFFTWATEHAFDALSAGPTQRDYSDGKVLAELSAYPLDVNLNYLNGWLLAHGLPAFAEKRLPSPRDWLFASRAYNRLGVESPAYLNRININDPQRQVGLDGVGNELETALRRISTSPAVTSTQGNKALFAGVLGYYNDKLTAFENVISTTETTYVSDLPNQILGRTTPINLFGGMDQTLTHVPAEFVKMTCGGTYFYPLNAPNNLKRFVANFNRYNLADYLHVSTTKVCLTGELVDMLYDNCYPDPQDPRLEICDPTAAIRATLTVYADGAVIGQQSVLSAVRYPVYELMDGTDHALNFWQYLKADFEALPLTQFAPQSVAAVGQLAAVSNAIEAKLGELQHGLYQHLLSAMSDGAVGTVRAAAIELAGAKKLLDSFITLGASDAIDNDDYFHALVFGEQRVLDTDQIIASYAVSATQVITGTNLLINPRLVLQQNGSKRSTALNERVKIFLDAITGQTHTEAIGFVASARQDLQLASKLAQPYVANKRVFIPVVRR
jgi:hypothetical protein